MAAREYELEPLIRYRHLVHEVPRGFRQVEQADLGRERTVAADAIDRPVARRGHQPSPRIGGGPVARPAFGGDRESLLSGLLGEGEFAEEADQAGEHAPPLVAEDLLED